jgi:hypothetical protein
MTAHRYTLRGKIGCRSVPLAVLESRALTCIGIYVVSCVLGWAAVGALVAVVWPG